MNARELKKWMEKTIKFQTEHSKESWTSHVALDENFAVHIGWAGGYAPEDTDVYHAEDDPQYCLQVKVGENITEEYAWVNMPFEPKSGEVWDMSLTLCPGENLYESAKWLLKEYRGARKAYRNGEVSF